MGNIVENYGTNKSDGATDVQYIILTFYFLIRKNIHLTEKTSEIGDYLYKYPKTPHENDEMRIYRPTVRSMFGAVQHDIYQHHQEFIRLFWKELLEIGGCNLRYREYINHFVLDENFIEDVKLKFYYLWHHPFYSFNISSPYFLYNLKSFSSIEFTFKISFPVKSIIS